MIEVHELSKHYGRHQALDNLSFSIGRGEVVGLLGPNGAGKTTTMRILTGFMPPSSGSACIAGFDVITNSMDVRRAVGYMPEHVPVYPDMTVKAYLTFWARLRGTSHPKRRVDAVLDNFGLSDRQRQLTGTLSKGLRQRLGLAQALVHDPSVIILDEPTIGIDPAQVRDVRQIVRQLGQERTVLLSTHLLSEAEQICDRVLIINRGRLVTAGKPASLRQHVNGGQKLFAAVKDTSADVVRACLSELPAVRRIEADGSGFVIEADANTPISEQVSTALTSSGLTVTELRLIETTLEDVFLGIMEQD